MNDCYLIVSSDHSRSTGQCSPENIQLTNTQEPCSNNKPVQEFREFHKSTTPSHPSLETTPFTERYDPITHAVPPNSKDDILVLTTGIIQESGMQFLQRLRRWDFILIYSSIIIVSLLFITVAYFGSNSEWYVNLIKLPFNTWFIRFLWVVASLLSYVGLFILWQHVTSDEIARDLIVSIFFMISSFLSLSWAVAFYYAQNIGLAVWLSLVIFVYKFWLFVYIWYIKPLAAIFLIPILLMDIYLVYSTLHISSSNGVPL
ncbi:Hypothetical protein HVR_LOCUS1120 [uncultured virus]|nr:Hypothetical protein HVR_LOCUS1120 [uncultured virus]